MVAFLRRSSVTLGLLALVGAAGAAFGAPGEDPRDRILEAARTDSQAYDNGFKIHWEAVIRHVAEDAPYRWTLPEGAKGVQLVEAALQSWKERRWVDVPALNV